MTFGRLGVCLVYQELILLEVKELLDCSDEIMITVCMGVCVCAWGGCVCMCVGVSVGGWGCWCIKKPALSEVWVLFWRQPASRVGDIQL